MVAKSETLNLFTELKALFVSEENWTKKSIALDKEGNEVYPSNESAFCYCLIGGIHKVCNVQPGKRYTSSPKVYKMYSILCAVGEIPFGTLATWNDMYIRTFEDVVNLIDKAIAFVKESEMEI